MKCILPVVVNYVMVNDKTKKNEEKTIMRCCSLCLALILVCFCCTNSVCVAGTINSLFNAKRYSQPVNCDGAALDDNLVVSGTASFLPVQGVTVPNPPFTNTGGNNYTYNVIRYVTVPALKGGNHNGTGNGYNRLFLEVRWDIETIENPNGEVIYNSFLICDVFSDNKLCDEHEGLWPWE